MTDAAAELIDISWRLDPEELPRWPGTPSLELQRWLDLEHGDQATDTRVSMSLHTGTHLDAPAHRLRGGRTVDHLSLESLNGRCFVADCRGEDRISESVIENADIPDRCERLLLRTDNSRNRSSVFDPEFVALTDDAASSLVDFPLVVLGFDYLSVEGPDTDGRIHERLLTADVALLEGLDLRGVSKGHYHLICFPLKFVATEAAPARACLRSITE